METRARLIAAAEEIIARVGFEALRVEEVVLKAGTAKGTFFAHFKDKDALMDLIIGARMEEHLNALRAGPTPHTPDQLADALMPLCAFMTSERYVFDLILRYSGATAVEEIGAIAATFGQQMEIFTTWATEARFREDISPDLQAEGMQAFMIQAMAAKFCALHNAQSIKDRLVPYLEAWFRPRA
ncbi:MAG: helix-turn-helix domain-containing protein [Pseudomonadota bacterium]